MTKETIIQQAKDFIADAKYVDSDYVNNVGVDFFESVLKLIENYEEEKNALIAGQETLQKYIAEQKEKNESLRWTNKHLLKTEKEKRRKLWKKAITDFAKELIKIGKTDGAFDYVDLWDVEKTKKALLNETTYEDKKTPTQEELLATAKEIINDYCEREFEDDEGTDFSDLSKVGIAYTTTENEKHEIQVNVNLVEFRIETLVDDKVIRIEQFLNLEDLTYNGLEGLDFDTLVSLEDEELERIENSEVPCKAGDTIYLLTIDKDKPINANVIIEEDVVDRFIIGNKFIQVITVSKKVFSTSKFGVTVFNNRKDAEEAQEKMNKKVEHI